MTAGETQRMATAADAAGPRVSVVVPHYHDLEGLHRCLKALEDQTFPRDRFEIIVADNGSPEGETAVAEVIAGRARLVTVAERGAGPARNGGVGRARGAVLAFTDSDCIPAPGWLSAGVAALERHDFVGGRMAVLVSDARRPTPTEAFELVFAFDNETYVTRKGFTVSANLFCSRDVFDRVGGFRNGVAEDLDWCLRARAAGFSLGYAAEAVVGHPARRNWPELRRKSAPVEITRLSLLSRSGATAGSCGSPGPLDCRSRLWSTRPRSSPPSSWDPCPNDWLRWGFCTG